MIHTDALKSFFVRTPLERPLMGLRTVSSRYKEWRTPELAAIWREGEAIDAAIEKILSGRPRANCVDVGAHVGSMLSQFVRLCPHGRHAAIEAIPQKASRLRRTFPEVDVYCAAVSNAPGRATFFINEAASGFSSLRPHDASGEGRHQEIEVEVTRLDDLLHPMRSIALLKIDIEGAELDAFRGAERTLREWHPTLIFECTESARELFGVTSDEMYDFLTGHGYAIRTPAQFVGGEPPLSKEAFASAQEYPFAAFSFIGTHGSMARGG